jgi:hypothetical protein
MRSTELAIVALIVLVVGLTSAGIIYATADDADSAAMEQIYGSKMYQRTLQQFGGKTSVLFDDLQRWLDRHLHGKALAATLAWITVAVAAVLFWVSRAIRR